MKPSQQTKDRPLKKRDVWAIEPGLIGIHQVFDSRSLDSGVDITGPFWLFGMIFLQRGSFTYVRGEETIVEKEKAFAVFIPPFSILNLQASNVQSRNFGFASFLSIPADMPKEPVALTLTSQILPESLDDIFNLVRNSKRKTPIGRTARSSVAERAKKYIDGHYTSEMKLVSFAKAIKTSPAVLTRSFRNSFAMTPVQYRNHLRITQAMIQLIHGTSVVDSAASIGFSSLSQFYAQFQKVAQASPSKFHLKKSKTRKKVN